MKPGIKTSEFWKSIVMALIGLAVTLGWIKPEDATTLQTGVMQIVGGVIMVAPTVAYIISRGLAKRGKDK